MRTQRDRETRGMGLAQALVPVLLAAVLASACAPLGQTVSTAAVHSHLSRTLSHPKGGHRWPAGSELRVDVSRLDPCDQSAVFRAFEAWLAPSDMLLQVREVESSDRANVVFLPVPDTRARFRGRTELTWDGPWATDATVQVALTRDGTPVSGAERQRILVHEVGHVLGLAHSQRLGSIMHPDPPGNRVDETDRAALAFLYGAPTAADAILAVAAPAPEPR